MAEYEVQFLASAAKEFRELPVAIKRRVGAVVEVLRKNPHPAGVRKLQGHERLYRIRAGQYRVIYEIDEKAKLIRVTRVRHKRETYR